MEKHKNNVFPIARIMHLDVSHQGLLSMTRIRRDFIIKSGGKKIYFKGVPHFINVIKHFWM